MGTSFYDRYSLLHFATGVVLSYWASDLPMWAWALAHFAFEFVENTVWGMRIINRFPVWPGGKTHPDSLTNMVGDTVFAVLGFAVGRYCQD